MAQLIWLKAVVPFAAVLLTAAAPASAAGTCKANTPAVTVGVNLREPVIDNTLPQREIQALSPGYHGGRTVGLYSARIEAKSVSRIKIVGLALVGAPACLSIHGRKAVSSGNARRMEYPPSILGQRPASVGASVVSGPDLDSITTKKIILF